MGERIQIAKPKLSQARRAVVESEARGITEQALHMPPQPGRTLFPAAPATPGGGSPLPTARRNQFEARFGYCFDDVRIHADRNASNEARSLGAHAFTRGSHIHFARPADALANETLLAHELAHVVQQRREPGLARHELLDEDPTLTAGLDVYTYEVTVTQPLDGPAFLVELLRQKFGVQDAAIAKAIIQEEELGQGFVLPPAAVKNGVYVVTLREDQILQIEWAVKRHGLVPPARGDRLTRDPKAKSQPTAGDKSPVKHSKQLADALARHAKLMPRGPALASVTEAKLGQLERLILALQRLTPAQRTLFADLADPTEDLDRYEASLTAFSEAVAGVEQALKRIAARPRDKPTKVAQKGGDVGVTQHPSPAPTVVDDLDHRLAATWKGVDVGTWGKLDSHGREALARDMAAKQRNVQLKYMVTHPGDTVKGMASSFARVDKLARDVWNDINDVADSSKSPTARAAAAVSAGKKTSMWVSAAIVVFSIVAVIINPALTINVWMMHAMALALIGAALAMTEAELRIQEAAEAKDFSAFQEAVAKAGSAQAEFIGAVAMAVIPLVGRILKSVPFVGGVVELLGKARKVTVEKFWATRGALVQQLRALGKGAETAVKAEGARLTGVATNVKLMTPAEFLEALKTDPALRDALGFDDDTVAQLVKLAGTPEGQTMLAELHKGVARTVADAPDIAQRFTEDYVKDLEDAAKKIEDAKTAEEATAALEDANRLLGDRAVSSDLTTRAEDYKAFRQGEAADAAKQAAPATDAPASHATKPAADQPAEIKPADQKPAVPETTTAPAADHASKPAADRPAETKPADEKPAVPETTTAPTDDVAPLDDVKPEEVGEVKATESAAGNKDRLTWDEARAAKLDKRSVPAEVRAAKATDLWKQWVDYVRARLKSVGKGLPTRRPITWDAFRRFLGKFKRGRDFQVKFTEKLQAEVGSTKTVHQDMGVISEALEAKVAAGEEGMKYADQVVTDNDAVAKFAKGEGPVPEVETFSNKSRDFAWHQKNGSLKSIIEADVAEALTKYNGKITIRRPGPLYKTKVTVTKTTIVYDASGIPAELLPAVEDAFTRASSGRVSLRIETVK